MEGPVTVTRWASWLVVCALVTLRAPSASAYSLQSGFTESCHEVVTIAAFAELMKQIDWENARFDVPANDDVWSRLASKLVDALEPHDPEAAQIARDEPRAAYGLYSLVVGVRFPDTYGHASGDLNALRRIHADAAPEGQYAHALRAPADDGIEGDLAAVEGSIALMRDILDDMVAFDGTIESTFTLDYYDTIDVLVYAPLFHLGAAMHLMQDSHAHSVRSDDGAYIVHVLNFVDAVEGTLDEQRDGIAHSTTMDDCRYPDNAPLVERAARRSAAMVVAAAAMLDGDDSLMERGLEPCPDGETDENDCGWLVYKPDCAAAVEAGDDDAIADTCCTIENDMCDSRYLESVRSHPAKPYLQGILFCSGHPGTASVLSGAGAAFIVLLVGTVVVRRRRGATRAGTVGIALVGALLLPREASAAEPTPYLGAEVHGALFSDIPNTALLNVAFGYGVRGGMRRERWGVFGVVEHDLWVPTEGQLGVDAGALSVAVGGEYIYAGGLLRTAVAFGPSFLLFDTALHDAGSAGVYFDLRPVGLRWPVGIATLVFDPLTLTVVAPAVSHPSVHRAEYRTLFGVDFSL